MRSSKIHLVIYLLCRRHGRGRYILEHSKLLHWSAQICSEKPFPNYSLSLALPDWDWNLLSALLIFQHAHPLK